MPGGRPTKYDPEFCDRVYKIMAGGLSKEAAAADIGVTRQTLYNWMKEHAEFFNAVKLGEDASRLWWERLGQMGAAGKVVNFSATAWIFNMKNRVGIEWKDKIEQTNEMHVNGQVQVYLPDNGREED